MMGYMALSEGIDANSISRVGNRHAPKASISDRQDSAPRKR